MSENTENTENTENKDYYIEKTQEILRRLLSEYFKECKELGIPYEDIYKSVIAAGFSFILTDFDRNHSLEESLEIAHASLKDFASAVYETRLEEKLGRQKEIKH